jgi:hypothetical protein
MQELTNSIKRLDVTIMDIKEEKVQAKGIHNIFNKKKNRNFTKSRETMPIQIQEASTTPNTLDQNRTTPQHIIKTTSIENRERILKAVREKRQITSKGKPIKITDFSKETLKARRA